MMFYRKCKTSPALMSYFRKIMILAMMTALPACGFGTSPSGSDGYAHKTTHDIAHAMASWHYDRAEAMIMDSDKDLLLVPRLREFSTGFSRNYASVYFFSKGAKPTITVKSVKFTAPDTAPLIDDRERTFTLDKRVIKAQNGTKVAQFNLPYEQVIVFGYSNDVDVSAFQSLDTFTVSVTYRVNEGPFVTEDFEIEKYRYRSGMVWPT